MTKEKIFYTYLLIPLKKEDYKFEKRKKEPQMRQTEGGKKAITFIKTIEFVIF